MPCEKDTDHDWVEEYYGTRCRKCDTFYTHGCEPWNPINDDANEIDDSNFMFEDFDDYENACDGCGRSEFDDGWCPLCCPNGGCFAPGTEDCDWCEYEAECARRYR